MDAATDGLVLRPDLRRAARWSVAMVGVLAAFLWVLLDSGGHVLAWVAVTFAAVVAGYFVAQLLVPSRFTVVLDQDGLRARFLWSQVDVRWERVHVARVTTLAGEPYLELVVGDPDRGGRLRRRQDRGLLLPFGCDLGALHTFLAQRLGRGDPDRPRTFTTFDDDEDRR